MKDYYRNRQQPQLQAMQQPVDKYFGGIYPVCELKAMPQRVTRLPRVERIRPVLFQVARSTVAVNHSTDNNQHRLLTKWQTPQNCPIKKRWIELTCIKCEKSSRILTSMYKSLLNIHLQWYYNQDNCCKRWKRSGMMSVRLLVKIHVYLQSPLLEHCR